MNVTEKIKEIKEDMDICGKNCGDLDHCYPCTLKFVVDNYLKISEFLTTLETPIRCMCGKCEPPNNAELLWQGLCCAKSYRDKEIEKLKEENLILRFGAPGT